MALIGATIKGGTITSPPPPPSIGDAYGGGFYAGQISTAGNGVADYNLIVAPAASGQSSYIQVKTSRTSTAGASSSIDGPANSVAMNNTSHPAAYFCKGLTIGGFSDWYMPANNELEVCYYNLKPTTTPNTTVIYSGQNANAVPSRNSSYTSGTPAQTSATNFRSGGAEAFAAAFYWASTEASSAYGWGRFFTDGYRYSQSKTLNFNVRAVRRVAI